VKLFHGLQADIDSERQFHAQHTVMMASLGKTSCTTNGGDGFTRKDFIHNTQ